MINVDVTGAEVSVVGNRDDEHYFRLNNPEGQQVISSDGTYEAEFTSHLGTSSPVTVDISELATGTLIIPVKIEAGELHVRRLNPRRTIITFKVEAR